MSTTEESSVTSTTDFTSEPASKGFGVAYSTDFDSSIVTESNNRRESIVTTPTREYYNDKSEAEDIESFVFYRRTRFWAICFAVTIVLLAILIPLIVLVIFPAVAQNAINKSNLALQEMLIKSPTDQNFKVDMKGSVTNVGSFNSHVEFPEPVSIYYNDQLVGYVELDPMETKGGVATLDSRDKTFTINNTTSFATFTHVLLTSEEAECRFKGRTKVKAFGITKDNLNFEKVIKVKGSNNLEGSNVNEIGIQEENNQYDISSNITIVNSSPVGIEIGTLEFDVYYNGTFISHTVLNNFTLLPGNSTFVSKGIVPIPKNPVDLLNLANLMRSYLSGTPSIMTSKNITVRTNGGNEVGWLTSVMGSTELNIAVGVSNPPKIVNGVEFTSAELTFTPETAYNPKASIHGMASYKLPFNINFTVLQVSQNVTMFQQGTPIASIITDYTNASNDNQYIYMNADNIEIKAESEEAFDSFIKQLTLSAETQVQIKGKTSVIANTLMGKMPLEGIGLDVNTTLKGFQGLQAQPPKIGNVDVLDGSPDGLLVSVDVGLFNPTNTTLNGGNVSLEMDYNNQSIGLATISNLRIVPGDNNLTAKSIVDPNGNPALREVIANYLAKTPTAMTVKGYTGSSNIKSLDDAFSATLIQSQIPLLQVNLIQSIAVDLVKQQTIATFLNPISAPITIESVNTTLSIPLLGQSINTNSVLNIKIPGKTNATTSVPIPPGSLFAGGTGGSPPSGALSTIISGVSSGNGFESTIQVQSTGLIGSYRTILNYTQSANIQLTLS